MSASAVARCLVTSSIIITTILALPAYATHKDGHGGGPTPSATTLSTLGCSEEGQVARVDVNGEWVCDIVADGVDGSDGETGPEGTPGADAQPTINYLTTDQFTPTEAIPIGARITMTSPCSDESDQITGGGCQISGAQVNTGWLLQGTLPALGVTQPDGSVLDEWQCAWTCNTPVSADGVVFPTCDIATFEITAICADQP